MNKPYKLGIDISSKGFLVITDIETKNIIDICQLPQPINNNKEEIKNLNKQIKDIEPNLYIKGQTTKTKNIIAELKRQISNIEESSPKNNIEVYNWLNQYKDKILIANIEKKICQTANNSTIKTFMKLSEYQGITKTLLDLCEIKYNIISIADWRKKFNYRTISKEEIQKRLKESNRKSIKESDIKREFVKEESIRIASELIPNIEDYWRPKGCKNINDDICESALLSLI